MNDQLNGYKFSFNRVNPYVKNVVQNEQKANGQNDKKQTNEKNKQVNEKSDKNIIIDKFFKSSVVEVDKSGTMQIKARQNLKNTKEMFYKKFQQSQKNRMLVDLYMRKTKFKKVSGLNNKSQMRQKMKGLSKNSNTNLSRVIKQIKFCQVELYKEKQTQVNGNKIIQSERKQKQHTSFKKAKKSKSFKNFYSNKFLAYLSPPKDIHSSKQYLKIGNQSKYSNKYSKSNHNKSQTAPIQQSGFLTNRRCQQLKLKYLQNEQEMSQIDKQKPITNRKKNNYKKKLRIATEMSLRQENDMFKDDNDAFSDILQVQTTKSGKQGGLNIRGNLGALKYKTPRINLSSRVGFLQNKNHMPKIKLFTKEQEAQIIKQFYQSNSKQNQ